MKNMAKYYNRNKSIKFAMILVRFLNVLFLSFLLLIVNLLFFRQTGIQSVRSLDGPTPTNGLQPYKGATSLGQKQQQQIRFSLLMWFREFPVE